MDEVIDIREDGAPGVAIRRQRRRFPFEIFNTLLTVICLASAVLVVYKLLQPQPGEEAVDKGPFMFVIHADAAGISGNNIKLTSDNPRWVKSNTIIVPCDGIYLLYAQVKSRSAQTASQVIVEKTDNRSTGPWPLGRAEVNNPLVFMLSVRSNEIIYMKLNQSEKITEAETYLGIVLLHAQQDVKFCQEILQMNL